MLKNRKLGSVRQMDKELKKAKEIQNPANGWINSIRRLLNISLQQLGNYAGLTGQGVYALEKREKEGKITLKKLREIASVFDMHVVYAFIPRTSLEDMIEKKAKEKAREIVQFFGLMASVSSEARFGTGFFRRWRLAAA